MEITDDNIIIKNIEKYHINFYNIQCEEHTYKLSFIIEKKINR